MKKYLPCILILCCMTFHAGFAMPGNRKANNGKPKRDTLQVARRSLFKPRHEDASTTIIKKMTDAELMLLIDHMFEATYMPPDLWSQVMVETAKRNLSKITRRNFVMEETCSQPEIHIEKLHAKPLASANDPDMIFLYPAGPANNKEWEEDATTLFKDQFTLGATHTIELENSEYGCFTMPSWGPLSSPFGWRHSRYHKGVDIQLRKGDTVSCAFDGTVRFAEKKGAYGNVVIVRHYNGLETVYGHLQKILVAEGQVVGSGDLLGLAGSTGKSTGPHLHFEVRYMGAPVDPQHLISFDYGTLLYNTVELRKRKIGLLSAIQPGTEFHTVQPGETFTDIAIRYCTTTTKLRQMNGIAPKQYIRLQPGRTLRVQIIDPAKSVSYR